MYTIKTPNSMAGLIIYKHLIMYMSPNRGHRYGIILYSYVFTQHYIISEVSLNIVYTHNMVGDDFSLQFRVF